MRRLKSFSRRAMRPRRFLSHCITITSETGVGSSTTLTLLQKELGLPWRFVSGGSIMRTFAKRLGMTVEEFAKLNLEHPEKGYDRQCDEMIQDFGKQNYVVVEGRLPHAFVPQAFHVYLVCSPAIRARRRKKDMPGKSLAEVALLIKERDLCDNARYTKMYPDCLWPRTDFDLVIDTGRTKKDQVVKKIMAAHARWALAKKRRRQLMSRLHIPTTYPIPG